MSQSPLPASAGQAGLVVAFCCEHSAYPAVDFAGRMKLGYPENIRNYKSSLRRQGRCVTHS